MAADERTREALLYIFCPVMGLVLQNLLNFSLIVSVIKIRKEKMLGVCIILSYTYLSLFFDFVSLISNITKKYVI